MWLLAGVGPRFFHSQICQSQIDWNLLRLSDERLIRPARWSQEITVSRRIKIPRTPAERRILGSSCNEVFIAIICHSSSRLKLREFVMMCEEAEIRAAATRNDDLIIGEPIAGRNRGKKSNCKLIGARAFSGSFSRDRLFVFMLSVQFDMQRAFAGHFNQSIKQFADSFFRLTWETRKRNAREICMSRNVNRWIDENFMTRSDAIVIQIPICCAFELAWSSIMQ